MAAHNVKRDRAVARLAKTLTGMSPEAARAEAVRRMAALDAYWAGSVSASVMCDYATGNVRVIRVQA